MTLEQERGVTADSDKLLTSFFSPSSLTRLTIDGVGSNFIKEVHNTYVFEVALFR